MQNLPVWFSFHCKKAHEAESIAKELGIAEPEHENREVDELINEARIAQMGRQRLTEVRRGVGDTGHPVFDRDGLKNVRIDLLIDDLLSRGYKAVNVRWRVTSQRDRATGKIIGDKHVIRVLLATPQDTDSEPLSEEFLKNFAVFCDKGSWQFCHVWENDYNDTVNLMGGMDPLAKRFTRLRLNDRGKYITDWIEPPKTPTP